MQGVYDDLAALTIGQMTLQLLTNSVCQVAIDIVRDLSEQVSTRGRVVAVLRVQGSASFRPSK